MDIRDGLTSMFDEVINLAAASYGPNDKARLTIGHDDLQEDVYVHLQNVENLTGESIMNRFERVLNSHQSMKADDSFDISVGLFRLNKGGAKNSLPLHPHLNNSQHSAILNKRSIVNIICDDERDLLCAAKSVIVAKIRLDESKRHELKNLTKRDRQCNNWTNGLTERAKQLQFKTQLPIDRPLTVAELAQFEDHEQVKIFVVQFVGNQIDPVLTPCSEKHFQQEIFLYLADNHYHPIVNISTMFRDHTLCKKCYTIYALKNQKDHPCNSTRCYVCKRLECQIDETVLCADCNMTCRSRECYQIHRMAKQAGNNQNAESLCQKRKKCDKCGKLVFTGKQRVEDHVCGTYQCSFCQEWVDTEHLCYLRRKKMKATSGRFLFFDFETMQDSVYQCDEGYSPKNDSAQGCGTEIPPGGECNATVRCHKCKLCRNCRKSNCGRILHQPNFVVAESCCDTCKNEILTAESRCRNCGNLCSQCQGKAKKHENMCQSPECGKRRIIFRGLDTTYKFCQWLISPVHRNFTCVAHNGKAYDFNFILNYLVSEARITPECIFAGAKLMGMEVKNGLNIRFTDSINFMGMALKKLPKAFGLKPEQMGLETGDVEELAKLPFPHEFNTRQNLNYKGPYPPLEMYGIATMSAEERAKVTAWYNRQRGKEFDMQQQLETYCTVDTSILRLACMTFRQLLMDITSSEADDGEITYVDCFAHFTIASTVMQCFRLNYLEEYYDVELCDGRRGIGCFKGGKWMFDGQPIGVGDISSKQFHSSNIGQIPAQGYIRNVNHSQKSIAWLEFQSKRLGREITHARNHGEHRVRCGSSVYSVDGYDPVSKVIYEFYGCLYHGCPHYEDRKAKDPRTGFTLEDLQTQTKLRENRLREAGFRIKSIYECSFDRLVKEDPDLQHFIQHEFDVPERMAIRDAFFGGRTSGFKLHYKCKPDEEIHYVDVCSLYPFINKTAKMPVGHPKIITRDFDTTFQSYFGIAHVKILPPRHEYLPVLPVRMRGKLTFPLCRSCASSEQQEPCNHGIEDRALTGVWCTPEIVKAIEKGYQVLRIYEVYHYESTSQYDPLTRTGGLFADQVDLFLKLKAQASGYPEGVTTDQQKDQYIKEFQSKCGVQLDKEKIEVNQALRSISKICLNSFWGKLAEKNNKVQSKFIQDTTTFTKFVSNTQYELLNFHIVNEDVMVLEYRNSQGFEQESNITNEVLAAFTTCFARMELYKHMESVGQNILYVDTDSMIFVTKKLIGRNGEIVYQPFPPVGSTLGELTNELPENTHITEFVCTAPKSYAYRTSDGAECVKFKGISLNEKNKKRINFQGVKELVFGTTDKITLEPQTQFSRSKFEGVVTNSTLIKSVVNTYNKRKVLENFDTRPFGYVEK